MKRFAAPSIHSIIYGDEELRQTAYRSGKARRETRAAAEAAEAERQKNRRPDALKEFFKSIGVELPLSVFAKDDEATKTRNRLLAMSAAEAWVQEHPIEEPRTYGDVWRWARDERRRLKSVRRIFREVGIK
jgi:hypothetical protein